MLALIMKYLSIQLQISIKTAIFVLLLKAALNLRQNAENNLW